MVVDQNTQSGQNTMTFSPSVYGIAVKNAQARGMSLQQYINDLVLQDESIPMVDEETEERIAKALDDKKNGKYVTVKTDEELDAFLTKLKRDALKE